MSSTRWVGLAPIFFIGFPPPDGDCIHCMNCLKWRKEDELTSSRSGTCSQKVTMIFEVYESKRHLHATYNLVWTISLLWERNHLFVLTWKLKCFELFCCRFFQIAGVWILRLSLVNFRILWALKRNILLRHRTTIFFSFDVIESEQNCLTKFCYNAEPSEEAKFLKNVLLIRYISRRSWRLKLEYIVSYQNQPFLKYFVDLSLYVMIFFLKFSS